MSGNLYKRMAPDDVITPPSTYNVWFQSDGSTATLSPGTPTTVAGLIYGLDSSRNLITMVGDTGATGAQGSAGGDYYLYTYSTAASAGDPGTGQFISDDELDSSVILNISKTDASSTDISTRLAQIAASDSVLKALIRITKVSDPAVYLSLKILGATAFSTYYSLNISDALYVGTLANTDQVRLEIIFTGDKGSTGATGSMDIGTTVALSLIFG